MTRFIEYNYLIAILSTIEEESKRAYKDIVYKYGYDDSNTDAALILRNATINTCGIIRDCISKNKEESQNVQKEDISGLHNYSMGKIKRP